MESPFKIPCKSATGLARFLEFEEVPEGEIDFRVRIEGGGGSLIRMVVKREDLIKGLWDLLDKLERDHDKTPESP